MEQPETFDAASVAAAYKLVVELARTVTVMPGEANAAAVPVETGKPLQSDVVKIVTVEPASAVPISAGEALLAGEAGLLELIVGAAGIVESST